jgi:hypothetical protein
VTVPVFVALNQLAHFTLGEAYVDAPSFLDRPCNNTQLSKMCAERRIANCDRIMLILNEGLLMTKEYWKVGLDLVGSFQIGIGC